ncbi:hydroxymethylpyrimidine kinase / phosphomethylpyrimidine kinase / thiamine-phosphate diphosphorylase [Burkholderiaceae bacterium]|nr:hydroxymethylpyrimidine kinase / phosphomethylpyrimidine kinase / thiamine-phosphate diphosphorylase [Burkholderiaceae bacterium]
MNGARRPIVWSIAGTDSGGGAGLCADQRMADAFGVHLCPIVAAITAQSSTAVTRVVPVGTDLLDAQLAALERDMPPLAIKTGLLGNAAQVECVARWVDRLREAAPVALVVDPVLGATTGASFADDATTRAYRELLLPRATLATPNRREAARLAGVAETHANAALPALARTLQRDAGQSICITGGDAADEPAWSLDWMATPHASGWLASPRVATPHHHGSGCGFATAAAAALALGFVAADALVLAKMAATDAIRHGEPAGHGAGPARAHSGFATAPGGLPWLSWSETIHFPQPRRSQRAAAAPLGLYAIVDSARRVHEVLAAGVRTVQLRIKAPAAPDEAWRNALRDDIRRSIAACHEAQAELFVNDHWRTALEFGARGVHLGQEDLLALSDAERAELLDCGVALGISTHSLWELSRAAAMAPRYVACGPVWPTLTKAMPWRPQGPHNLAWWCAMAPAPVVAIGGLLGAAQVRAAAQCGADGACIVRAIGDAAANVPALQAAWSAGWCARRGVAPGLPRPSL